MSGQHRQRQTATSVSLEIALYFGWWYDVMFWVLSLGVFIYKGWQLPYKVATYNTEITIFCLFTLINFPRLLLGSSGNKAEKLAHIIGMLALSGVAVMFHTYFITLQVFVLRIDQILGGTALALVATQMILAFVPAIRILKSL